MFDCCILEPKTLPTLITMNKTFTEPNNELSNELRDVHKEKSEGATSVNVKNEWKRIHSLLQDVVR